MSAEEGAEQPSNQESQQNVELNAKGKPRKRKLTEAQRKHLQEISKKGVEARRNKIEEENQKEEQEEQPAPQQYGHPNKAQKASKAGAKSKGSASGPKAGGTAVSQQTGQQKGSEQEHDASSGEDEPAEELHAERGDGREPQDEPPVQGEHLLPEERAPNQETARQSAQKERPRGRKPSPQEQPIKRKNLSNVQVQINRQLDTKFEKLQKEFANEMRAMKEELEKMQQAAPSKSANKDGFGHANSQKKSNSATEPVQPPQPARGANVGHAIGKQPRGGTSVKRI